MNYRLWRDLWGEGYGVLKLHSKIYKRKIKVIELERLVRSRALRALTAARTPTALSPPIVKLLAEREI